MPPTPVSKGRVDETCFPGGGRKTCAYLGMGTSGWVCLKGSNLEQLIIDRRASGDMRATSDNCGGPPFEKEKT